MAALRRTPSFRGLSNVILPAPTEPLPLTRPLDDVLDLVYEYYAVNTTAGEALDVEALFSVVSDVMGASLDVADPTTKLDDKEKDKSIILSNLKAPIHLLKKIACQMRHTRADKDCVHAHNTTMNILKDLQAYPCYARAVIALAAFALEYGNFWHLSQVSNEDNLGKSLAVLSHVHAIDQTRRDIVSEYNSVVRNVFSAVSLIVTLEGMLKQGYAVEDIPTLEKVVHQSPAFIYWTILTIVICASSIDILWGYSTSNYDLPDIGRMIFSVCGKLKSHKERIIKEKGERDEYLERCRVLQTPTGIIQVLKCLLFPKHVVEARVFYGSTKTMVNIDQDKFKKKCVLLFISGLFGIDKDIELLERINQGLKKDPSSEKGGIRREDFMILWVPIVPDEVMIQFKDDVKDKFDEVSEKMVKWAYVMDYSKIPSVCKKVIREKLKYVNKPVVPVFNHQGRRTNNDALAMLSAWELLAFPWKTGDDLALIQNWNWFWHFDQDIETWAKQKENKQAYNIIYGRTVDANKFDDSWGQKLPNLLEKITKEARIVIRYNHYSKGKDDHTVKGFWNFVENLFDSLIRKTTMTTTKDPSFDNVQKFLSLRQEKSGWVVITKGSEVKLCGRGEIIHQTLVEFDLWKHTIATTGSFEVAFEKYYNLLISRGGHNCLRLDLNANVSDVSIPLQCAQCEHEMKMEIVRYVCCHGDHDH